MIRVKLMASSFGDPSVNMLVTKDLVHTAGFAHGRRHCMHTWPGEILALGLREGILENEQRDVASALDNS